MKTDGRHSPTPESLADKAYRQIEEMIVRLELRPGAAISESFLCKQFDKGRTPVREALHRLAREGLVVISPRRGIFVTDISVDAQLRLLDVRRGVERLMAARAARLASNEERAAFASLAEEMLRSAKAADDVEFLRLDLKFNRMLSEVAANEFASAAISLMAGLSRRFWFRYYQALANMPHTAKLHAAVATAIAERDERAATEAADRLIDYIESFTRSVLDQAGWPSSRSE